MLKKLKSFLAEERSFYGFLVLVVGVMSFALGRASVEEGKEEVVPRVQITQENIDYVYDISSNDTSATINSTTKIIASRSGTRYHRADCPGAGQIKEANRIEFQNVAAARAAGYTPAANCPGLE